MAIADILHSKQDLMLALGVTAATFAGALLARRIICRRLLVMAGGRANGWLMLLAQSVARLHGFFLLTAAIYFGSLKLPLPEQIRKTFGQAAFIILLGHVAILCSHGIRFWVDRFSREKLATDAGAVTTLVSVSFLLHLVIWVILILIGLENLGVNIAALIAGLGITGIAVALAVQNILGDLFASFSIVLDKPFVIGDFIAIDGYAGSVEHIGLKTTRLRGPAGEQLIFANADLLKSRIRNFQQLRERHVMFSVRVALRTPGEKLREIPMMLRAAVENNREASFERAHFAEYGDHAIRFEAVYRILTSDYIRFMDIQQAVYFDIHERFAAAGIELV
jgi:small-conductance mechanosensitive channel